MNTITIELCKEDRQRLDDLIGGITLLASVIGSNLPKETQEAVIAEATEAPQVAETNSAADENPAIAPIIEATPVCLTEEAPAPVPEEKPVSLAEFQKAVTLAVSKGAEAKQAVKTIINQYATSVSGVPETKRAAVMKALADI